MVLKQRILSFLYRLWGHLPLPFWLRSLILRVGNSHFTVGVGAVILDEQGRVLLFHHTYRPEMPWGLPGGWLKSRETPVEALEREVREESQMQIAVGQPLVVRQLDFPGALDVVYAARFLGGTFRPCPEVDRAEFFLYPDLPPLYGSTIRAIELALRARRESEAIISSGA